MRALAVLLLFLSGCVAAIDGDASYRAAHQRYVAARDEPCELTLPDEPPHVGPDRVVIHGTHPGLPAALDELRNAGWRVGESPTDHFQLAGGESFHAYKIERGEVIRRLESGCTTPIDQWSLGWLHKGVDERPVPKREPATVEHAGEYPLRGSWWSFPGSTAADLRHHLKTGVHAGQFDPIWLEVLSWAELNSLHSDDHEGRVDWNRARKPPRLPWGESRARSFGTWCPT